MNTPETSLYFHIPFCTKKCPYCHFYVIPNQLRYHAILREALALEWELQRETLRETNIVSIYFGGGTPSLFGAEAIGEIIERCNPPAGAEITVEANPEESSPALFEALKAVGVNRISLGVQSLDDRSLALLERTHSAEAAIRAIHSAKTAGIDNVSIDLMYDLPGQTESSWAYTLEQVEKLDVQHLSLYNLTIEPHTSFHARRLVLPAPETSLRLLSMALAAFERYGFERYEISAFAKPGFPSRHNLGYWTMRPFLGFGPSAFSYWNGRRFQNTPNLQRYARALKQGASPVSFEETLPHPSNLLERFAVGLRLSHGCEIPNDLPEKTHRAIEKLKELGLIQTQTKRACLTEKGKLFYDSVASEII